MGLNSQQTRNKAVNFIKAVSVIAIFLIHCRFSGTAGDVIRGLASFGVPVFFMISGWFSYDADRPYLFRCCGYYCPSVC